MRIQLDHKEIEQALVAYVSTQGIDISDKEVEVDMVAGRGTNGHSATISITDSQKTELSSIGSTDNISSENDTEEATEIADETSVFSV